MERCGQIAAQARAAGAINQMFAHCCGHATIVARGQPLFGLIESCRVARRDGLDFESPTPGPSKPERDRAGNFCRGLLHVTRSIESSDRSVAEQQSAIRIIPAAVIVRSPACDARPEVTTPDINRVRKGSRHFCAAGTFCALFSSRDDASRHARRRRTCLSYARQNNVVRNLSQTLSIAVGIEARAKGSAARMPFASPYCPCRAQIRRVHVQPRTRLAVHSSMRVRESCLTFSPRASPHDSQNPWWSFVVS